MSRRRNPPKAIRVGNIVTVRADHSRRIGGEFAPYAKAGDRGEVIEVFKHSPNAHPDNKVWNAKVRIGDQVKTFRQTSLVVE